MPAGPAIALDASSSCPTPFEDASLSEAPQQEVRRPSDCWLTSAFFRAEHDVNKVYQGSCLCSAVRYELLSAPKAVSHCHCSQCRKGHGAAFATYGSVISSELKILSGADRLSAYRSSESVLREFCSTCRSTLFWSRDIGEFAKWVSMALGTLDTQFIPRKHTHVHLDSAIGWCAPSS